MADFLAETRRSHDATAVAYARWIDGELATKPLDRAVLTAFAELAEGPMADVGCGTGRITRFLNDRGVAAFGVDLAVNRAGADERSRPRPECASPCRASRARTSRSS